MDYEDKVQFCQELLAEDFKISESSAHRLIYDLDIDEAVFEYYKEELEEREREIEEREEKELKDNDWFKPVNKW